MPFPTTGVRLVTCIIVLCSLLSLQGVTLPRAAADSPLDRDEDPVVLLGSDVPSLLGAPPSEIAAFRYDGGWQQIAVQVDERFPQTFSTIYDDVPPPTSSTNIVRTVYADDGTFTGPDPDPLLDADDEIVFMARDAGSVPVGFSHPAHVIAGSGVQISISDPLAPDASGSVFLFRQDGTLDPAAGQSYVSYNFTLLSGDYKMTYNIFDGPNPEDTLVSTPYYSYHFHDRWGEDGLNIHAGAASGDDILDRHKALFAPGFCGRSEDTFNNGDANGYRGEGAFIANKSGPIRAIRSYLGANSGPNTQRDHIFYDQRQDVTTHLRVHQITSIMDFFDYSPAASGMTYSNDLNTSGVIVDGNPDSVTPGPIQWEMMTGPQGTLVMSGAISTSIAGLGYTSYYLDDSTPSVTQCTGDAFAYGSSGTYINQSIPCTDPGLGCGAFLEGLRIMYFLPPGGTDAAIFHARANAPLQVEAAVWGASVGGIAEVPRIVSSATAAEAAGGQRLGPHIEILDILLLAVAAGGAVFGLYAVRRNGQARR